MMITKDNPLRFVFITEQDLLEQTNRLYEEHKLKESYGIDSKMLDLYGFSLNYNEKPIENPEMDSKYYLLDENTAENSNIWVVTDSNSTEKMDSLFDFFYFNE